MATAYSAAQHNKRTAARLQAVAGGNQLVDDDCAILQKVWDTLESMATPFEKRLADAVLFSKGFKIYMGDYSNATEVPYNSEAPMIHATYLKSIMAFPTALNSGDAPWVLFHECCHALFARISASEENYERPFYGTPEERNNVRRELKSFAIRIEKAYQEYKRNGSFDSKLRDAFNKLAPERYAPLQKYLKETYPHVDFPKDVHILRLLVYALKEYRKKYAGKPDDLFLEEYIASMAGFGLFQEDIATEELIPHTYKMMNTLLNTYEPIFRKDAAKELPTSDDMFSEDYVRISFNFNYFNNVIRQDKRTLEEIKPSSSEYVALYKRAFRKFQEAVVDLTDTKYKGLYPAALSIIKEALSGPGLKNLDVEDTIKIRNYLENDQAYLRQEYQSLKTSNPRKPS